VSCEGDDCKTIVYADSLSPISSGDYRFSDHPDYVAAYYAGLDRLAELDCDILLTPHPSASGMRDKLIAGDLTAGPTCRDYAEGIRTRLDARLAEEAAAQE
jgi:metallo-beta-lactamase class B